MELVRAGTDAELAMLSLAIVCVVGYAAAAAEIIGSRQRRGRQRGQRRSTLIVVIAVSDRIVGAGVVAPVPP